MSDQLRAAPRLRCPSCNGFVSLAAGTLNLTTGEREACCWTCGGRVVWTDDTLAIELPSLF
jgi:hypothetical protein